MSTPRLADRRPELSPDEMVGAMTPPPRFDEVRFDTYVPNPDEPSQAAAVEACGAFAERVAAASSGGGSWWKSLFGGRKADPGKPGLYLDGGFGVGKTHLLASTWHAVPGPKSYGTFVELTNLVGALGFAETVRRLSEHRLLAIDEFELDDPGDTMLVTQLIAKLSDAGVHVAATSNTLPDKLGEGRFAAVDFLREIHAMAARFDVVRVDGPDYRHRGLPDAPDPMGDGELTELAAATDGATLDDFEELCAFLARLHPSKYGRLVDGVSAVHLRGVQAAPDQDVALRLVALADRLYDRAIPVRVSGESLPSLFTEEMLAGGYRKKYLRATSRLTALSRDLAKS
ncbi:cell division protein ZapE [Saccharopolyspora erythraea NRRL 2338]|uniref:ATP/GTP-binding integral membrane protein n=2 Tax=Saccharopolyspora erythraea TaxID=1836 RepID=A4FAV9_SACEN|nr:cell division protein ZapE [Saccharopolyspora erythraea]EQD87577.1 ATPase [Saccharopolyspora erythraea D]PFG94966.1 cell division protein ZapE [Saccharopolyspora erythraea NRRL 2338]QRK91658.1 cell division protein ZapE [Saccharopolyspora erythraea]CAM01184.1 ATP/GTP-binding integral membrane protein [Saccharopolyspora erythraea NRRL 2338]